VKHILYRSSFMACAGNSFLVFLSFKKRHTFPPIGQWSTHRFLPVVALNVAPSVKSGWFIPFAMACCCSSQAMKASTLFKLGNRSSERMLYRVISYISKSISMRIGVCFFLLLDTFSSLSQRRK